MRKIGLFVVLILSMGVLQAQNLLTLEDAVDIALKNNFDILVARNDADIAKLNNTKGNAGMLPTINLNGSATSAYNNVYQKTSGGTIYKYPEQFATVLGANAELSWTLYDGGKMFVTKKKLEAMQALGEIQFNAKVLEVTYNIVAAYYDIIRQKQTLESLNEIIAYNKQRVVIAETSFKSGLIAKTDLLQAKIDLNVATEDAINQQYTISESQKTLNFLLGKPSTDAFAVTDSIPFSASIPDKNELILKLASSNADILEMQKQIDVANLALKEMQKGNMPIVTMTGGYYLSRTQYSQASTLLSRLNGPEVGGTLSIPLYTGGENKRKIAVAKTELITAQYNLENAKQQVRMDLENAYTDYENQKELLRIERDNNLLAKENMEICLHRLKLGETTSLEVHQAQENYVESSTRLINFQYNLKIQETKLKQLVSAL